MTNHKLIKFTTALLIFLIVSVLISWQYRQFIYLHVFSLEDDFTSLSEPTKEPDSVTWFDDYYTIEYINETTIAIGEPRYWQANYNYLILGDERAILFDTGAGIRDIKPVVESLTDLPITAAASHLHYDHIGNSDKFDQFALLKLPHLLQQTKGNILQVGKYQHIGFLENFSAPKLSVTEWWQDRQSIDLGNRELTVIHTPGHTSDSMALYDANSDLLFTGDFIYDGELYALLPGSNLEDYLATSQKLLSLTTGNTQLLTAHRTEMAGAPILKQSDLADLKNTLEKLNNKTLIGDNFFINNHVINDKLSITTE